MNHVAITGTKGKTTITRIVQHVLMSENNTVYGEYGIDGSFEDGLPIKSYRPAAEYFEGVKNKNFDFMVSEATSYVLGLEVYRDFPIKVGAFTGLEKNEHSELYESTEEYLQTKKKIFSYLDKEGVVFVSKDSEYYDDIIYGQEEKVVSYGFSEGSDAFIEKVSSKTGKTSFTLNFKGDQHKIVAQTYGKFNVLNLTAAFCICTHLGISSESIIEHLSTFPGIKGRSNVYHIVETDSLVVIDYAHTPESLKYQLEFLNENKGSRKIVTVFGCGGDKSKEKRPEMGAVAAEMSDFVVLTNDNPRGEHPRTIAMDILNGIPNIENVEIILDREQAIKTALSTFNSSIILIAGKGNEKGMEMADSLIPMTDIQSVELWMAQNAYTLRGYFDYLD